MDKKYKIAILSGDGVGKEVMQCALKVLDAVDFQAQYEFCDIGWEFWKKEGNPLPERTLKVMKECQCGLLGAITSKPKSEAEKELSEDLKGKGYTYRSPIVALRKLLDLYVNIRPSKSITPKVALNNKDVDITVFRENTEGLYCGIEYDTLEEDFIKVVSAKYPEIKNYPANESSVSMRIVSSNACKRVLRAAFEFADKNGKKCVTIADKPNILRATGGRFIEEARKMQKEYPHILLREVNVDAVGMMLVKKQEDFEVIVAENMFGDIISDLTAQIAGGMGFAYSANIGNDFALFEPVHGSAPKYTGMKKVNPSAMILSAAWMLEWLGETEKSKKIFDAVRQVVEEEKVVTYDIGGNAANDEMTDEIIKKIKANS